MDAEELKVRTKKFALRVMLLIDCLPNTVKGRVIANQLMRAATSVGANYRAACRGRSHAEFFSNEITAIMTASHKTAQNNR